MPTVAVEGIGAVRLAMPPLAVVYQSKVSDASAFVAVKAAAVSPWQ